MHRNFLQLNLVLSNRIMELKELVSSVWFSNGDSNFQPNMGTTHEPAVNICVEDDIMQLELASPGFEKGDLRILLEKEELVVFAHAKKARRTKRRLVLREFEINSFKRKFTLPENVNIDLISASYANGVLLITLPLGEQTAQFSQKEIEIS